MTPLKQHGPEQRADNRADFDRVKNKCLYILTKVC